MSICASVFYRVCNKVIIESVEMSHDSILLPMPVNLLQAFLKVFCVFTSRWGDRGRFSSLISLQDVTKILNNRVCFF